MENPIPFNPHTMTVIQLTECADTLSQAFDGIKRGVDAHNIVFHLERAAEIMNKRWKEV